MKRVLSMLIISLLFPPLSSAPAGINGPTISSGDNPSVQIDSASDDSGFSFAQTPVPEPGALAFLLIGGIGVLARRRRRRSR